MTQYIDKSALVAEIERRRDESWLGEYTKEKGIIFDITDEILSFLDTLGVKEVDLKKEIENYFKGWSEDIHNGAACHYQYVDLQDCKSIAKHFFELGLKAQKGEEVQEEPYVISDTGCYKTTTK